MTPSQQIKKQITEIKDWRGEVYGKIRNLINQADPGLKEEIKWGSPIWVSKTNVCSICVLKDHVKVMFFQGASLDDPDKLFNAGFDAKKTRAIDLFKNDLLDEKTFKKLIVSAVKQNRF
jgi:hypothetical protein